MNIEGGPGETSPLETKAKKRKSRDVFNYSANIATNSTYSRLGPEQRSINKLSQLMQAERKEIVNLVPAELGNPEKAVKRMTKLLRKLKEKIEEAERGSSVGES